jgi:hypothetical protein
MCRQRQHAVDSRFQTSCRRCYNPATADEAAAARCGRRPRLCCDSIARRGVSRSLFVGRSHTAAEPRAPLNKTAFNDAAPAAASHWLRAEGVCAGRRDWSIVTWTASVDAWTQHQHGDTMRACCELHETAGRPNIVAFSIIEASSISTIARMHDEKAEQRDIRQ